MHEPKCRARQKWGVKKERLKKIERVKKNKKEKFIELQKKHVRIWYKIIKFYNKNAQSIKNVHLTNMFLNGID